jgi:hypothetical protein
MRLDGRRAGAFFCFVSLAPIISLDFSRSNARARSNLNSRKTYRRPKRKAAPEYCKMGGRTQRRRLATRTASLASQQPVDWGSQEEQLAASWGKISTLAIRAFYLVQGTDRPSRLPQRPGVADSEVISEAVGPREWTARIPGHGTNEPSSCHAGNAIGRLAPRSCAHRPEYCLTHDDR